MVNKLFYRFSTTLHEKLKKMIVGKNVCMVDLEGDTLQVNITGLKDFTYSYTIENLSHKILHGYSTDDAVIEVVGHYKRTILKLFFKEGEIPV